MFFKNRFVFRVSEIACKFSDARLSFLAFLVLLPILLSASCGGSGVPSENSKTAEKKPVELPAEARVNFLAVGDIMLSRGVHSAIEREGNPLMPFNQIADLLSSTDFNFGNLESPVSGNDKILGRGLVFNAHTKDTVGLTKYNFKIVNLANNHALDQGINGLRNTQKFLDEKEIKYVGVGDDKNQAWQGKIVEVNGIKIGFIGASYASINDGGVAKNDYVARIEELESLKSSIEKLKGESDFVVVTMHAGIEYTRNPHQPQITFARTAIDAGADMVIGAHPHWIQTFEQYRGKYIFYSLGNFVFDQRKPDTKEGLVLHINLQRKKVSDSAVQTQVEKIELIPVIIEKFAAPRRANEAETKAILKKFGATEAIISPASAEK